jgi:mRNA-degrading endonuclease RelE of RelBE toxin-antitoxin system
MVFVESPVFTALLLETLTDDEYSAFQRFLMRQPYAGTVIQETGGLRKVRWSVSGKGKRGGVRVIYYYADEQEQIRLLLIYKKARQEELTASQKKQLRAIKDRWK